MPVAVGVGEAADVDLVDDGVPPPRDVWAVVGGGLGGDGGESRVPCRGGGAAGEAYDAVVDRRRPQRPGLRGLPRRRRRSVARARAHARCSAARRGRSGCSPATTPDLSKYSYLVSLLPQLIVDELGLDVTLRRRQVSSYTPRGAGGVLVDAADPAATRGVARRRRRRPGTSSTRMTARVAERVFPTLTEPLRDRDALRRHVGDDDGVDGPVERPIGELLERRLADDTVRGIVLTDALIGTFADAHDLRRQPLLPVPRGRRRDRALGRAGRRHGHGHGAAGRRPPGAGRRAGHRRRGHRRGDRRPAGDGHDRRRPPVARPARSSPTSPRPCSPGCSATAPRRRRRRAPRSRSTCCSRGCRGYATRRRPGAGVRRHVPRQRGLRASSRRLPPGRGRARSPSWRRARSTATR